MTKKNKTGFTLIEMLVVIAIIGILASLLAPSLNSAMGSGRSLKCLSNLKNLGIAGKLYSEGNNNQWPLLYTGDWAMAYIHNKQFLDLYMGNLPFATTMHNGVEVASGNYVMPPQYLCPENDYQLTNGLAYSFQGYPMSRQGFADVGLALWAPGFSYKLSQVKQPSRKLVHLDGKNWHMTYTYANPANATATYGVNYIHNKDTYANAVFFDLHAESMGVSELYESPRKANDCWDTYGAL